MIGQVPYSTANFLVVVICTRHFWHHPFDCVFYYIRKSPKISVRSNVENNIIAYMVILKRRVQYILDIFTRYFYPSLSSCHLLAVIVNLSITIFDVNLK